MKCILPYKINIPKKINLCVLLTMIVFLTPVVMQLTRNNYVKLIEDVAYLIMLLQSVYIILRQNKVIIGKSITTIVFLLLFIVGSIIGIYYNGLTIVILQYREFKYLLLPIIMIPYTSLEYFKPVWTVLKAIAAFSVPVAIAQWIIYRDNGDRITGLLGYGGSGTLTIFLLIIVFSELGKRLQNNEKIVGLYLLYIVPTFINETKITFVLIPIMLVFALVLTKKLKSKQALIGVVVCATLLLVWAYLYQKTYSKSIFDIFSKEYLSEYLYTTEWEGDAGRFAKVMYAFNIIKDRNLLFGYGLGSSYMGATSGATGYAVKHFFENDMFRGTRPQAFVSLLDMGLLGCIILLLVLIFIFLKVLNKKESTIYKFIAVNSLIVLFVTLLYQSIFYTYQFMFILVLFTTLHTSCKYRLVEDQNETN